MSVNFALDGGSIWWGERPREPRELFGSHRLAARPTSFEIEPPLLAIHDHFEVAERQTIIAHGETVGWSFKVASPGWGGRKWLAENSFAPSGAGLVWSFETHGVAVGYCRASGAERGFQLVFKLTRDYIAAEVQPSIS